MPQKCIYNRSVNLPTFYYRHFISCSWQKNSVLVAVKSGGRWKQLLRRLQNLVIQHQGPPRSQLPSRRKHQLGWV